ncbi:unnamed protein product [Periconia digitata]|uniref:Capsule polysaccharide biosynthesis protein n=1 Tax=Periconia digitata TaxID=1303443 RepID=A0A9W4U2U8_9PLEO|nr:unnamed protein product [Periconia digitata]
MSPPQKYTIPPEYQSQLTYHPCPDTRSDAEILSTLSTYRPITSEKNIWAYWHSGLHSMPPWCQRNVASWVRMHSSTNWTIRVLDSTPASPNYFLNYVSGDHLPDAFVGGTMDGPYVGPHSADMLRGACLFAHGGVFMDVGIPIVRGVERVCWGVLESEGNGFEVAAPWVYGTHVGNHFVAARKGSEFIRRWHKLFTHLWQNHTNSTGLMQHPLMTILSTLPPPSPTRPSKFQWDISQPAAKVDEYVTQVQCWNRLCHLSSTPSDPFSGADYWSTKVLLWDGLLETWGAETTLGFKGCGRKMYEYFSMKVDGDEMYKQSAKYKDAERVVWRLLAKSSMQKVFRGKALTVDKELGELWDEDDQGRDCGVGTFGELFRWGCENFWQTRDGVEVVGAPRPGVTFEKGLLEV